MPDNKLSGVRGSGATRDMSHLRHKPKVTELIKQGVGYLTDQSGNYEVRMDWDLNKQAVKDGIFKLTVDDKEVYIDLQELMFYTRIFFQKS